MSSAYKGQMNKGVRPPLPISWRDTSAPESHLLIKSDCLIILCVHVGRHRGVHCQTMTNQGGTDALAARRRINKEGLHMTVLDEHECQRLILLINREP